MSDFEEAMVRALLAPEGDAPAELRDLVAHPAFAVYRNTVLKGCVDALEANFPTVLRLVGAEWFRSAALDFVRLHPPADARLLVYGDDSFATWLQGVPTAADLPYLADVARLDSLWRACHSAADAPVLPPATLAGLPADTLAARALWPHPATRWAWFEGQPVASIWSRNRGDAGADTELAWAGEGLLLTREGPAVRWQLLPRAGCAFLDACAAGLPLGAAAERSLRDDPDVDLGPVLQQLLQSGAFTFPATTRNLP